MKNIVERLKYIDHLKGLAIIFVVMGHFIQYNTVESIRNSLFEVIYSFHMPLFMFISGYVAFKTITDVIFSNYLLFLKKKAISLLIPFFIWPLIIQPFCFKHEQLSIIKRGMGLLVNPGAGLWFLWFLFFMSLIYSLFLRISTKQNQSKLIVFDLVIFLVIFVAVFSMRFVGVINYIDSFCLHLSFFFIGVFVSKYEKLRVIIMKNIVFAISIFGFALLSPYYEFISETKINLIIKCYLSLLAIIILYNVFRRIDLPGYLDKLFVLFGQNSLIIYVTHFSFIYVLPNQYHIVTLPIFLELIIPLIFSISIIFLCIIIGHVITLSKFLNLVVYGKMSKSYL